MPKRQRLLLVLIMIGMLGITGVLILINDYAENRVQTKTATQDFSSFEKVSSTPLSWKSYLEIGKNFEKLEQNLAPQDSKPDVAATGHPVNDSDNLDLEAIDNQTGQIEGILKEEKDFKLLMLNNNVRAYESKLSEDKERRLKEKSSVLNHAADVLVKNKEKEIAAFYESYDRELRAKYQDVLCNLQLQLSVVDLMDVQKDQDHKKQQLQTEINRIHQEISEKLKSRRQELNKELIVFKTARLNENESELNKFKVELETNFEFELSRYKEKQREEFDVWHLNREKEVAAALKLRQEQRRLIESQTKSN